MRYYLSVWFLYFYISFPISMPESRCFKPKDESFQANVHVYGFMREFGVSELVSMLRFKAELC
jgi:hypothetical protein